MLFIRRKTKVCFTVRLAGIPIEIKALYGSTKKFCMEYRTDEAPAVSVSLCRADIKKERKLARLQAKNEGRKSSRFSARYLETLALCRRITSELLPRDVILFHGSVIALDGKAYLFTAKSGTGKTTHSKLWLENYPESYILNGDKPLLMLRDGRVYVCGSPWRGKEKYGVNEILPLEAICILQRDETNHIEEITLKEGFEMLVSQCHIPEEKGSFARALSLVKQLSSVSLYRLGCNTEKQAAEVSHNKIVKE